MDREELTELVSNGPVRIRMNNGEVVDIPNSELATVSDISAAVLVRGDDGRFRHRHFALVCICSVEEVSATSDA